MLFKKATSLNELFEIGPERCSVINLAIMKLVDLFIYKETVYFPLYTDVFHADIF